MKKIILSALILIITAMPLMAFAQAGQFIPFLRWTNATGTRATTTSFFSTTASTTNLFASIFNLNGFSLSSTANGTIGGTNTGDVTLAGVPDYITISGQTITRGTVDISDDTNLTGGLGLTITGDDMACDTASGSVFGCLASADWTIFNNKLSIYDAFTHPQAGTSATTSGMIFNSASSTFTSNLNITGNSTTTHATTTSIVSTTASSSNLWLGIGGGTLGCVQVTAQGLLTNTGTACGSGSGGGNSKFATSSADSLAIHPSDALRTGFGTTTPKWAVQVASSTGAQLTLSDPSTLTNNHWSFRNAGGVFYVSTSSPVTFATSTVDALRIDANGKPAFPYLVSCSSGVQTDANGAMTCGTSGTTAWNSIGDATGPGAIAMTESIQTLDWDTNGVTSPAADFFKYTLVNDGATDVLTQRLLTVENSAGSTASTEVLLRLVNAGATVPTGLVIDGTAITTAIDASDADIGSALLAGENDLSGNQWVLKGATSRLGLGTSTPWASLSIHAGAGSTTLAIGSSTASYFVVNQNGEVGVGTTTAGFALGVRGNLKVTSNIELTGGFQIGSANTLDGINFDSLDQMTGQDAIAGVTSMAWTTRKLTSGLAYQLNTRTAGGGTINTLNIENNSGFTGFATTTPKWLLQLSTSTAPQLTLSDTTNLADNHWSLRNIRGSLFFATSSPTTYATSTKSIFEIDANGKVTLASNLHVLGNSTTTNATTTNIFSGTASSTNLFSTNGWFSISTTTGKLILPIIASNAPTEDGVIGYDSTQEKYVVGDSGTTGSIARVVSVSLPNTSLTNSVATDQDFASVYTIPANKIITNKMLRVSLTIEFVTGVSTVTSNIYLKLGATKVYSYNAANFQDSVTRSITYQFLVHGTAAAGAAANVVTGGPPAAIQGGGQAGINNIDQPVALATNGTLDIVPGVIFSGTGSTETYTILSAIVEELN